MSTAPPPSNPEGYQQFHDEGDKISKTLQLKAGQSQLRFPSLVVQNKLPAPFSVLDSDLALKEVHDAKFNLAYIANENNSDNTIFIARGTLGGFLTHKKIFSIKNLQNKNHLIILPEVKVTENKRKN